MFSRCLLCEETGHPCEWERRASPSLIEDGKITSCKSENDVPIEATYEELCVSGVGIQASGDRLTTPGFQTAGHQSRIVPERPQLLEERLSGEPPGLTYNVVVEQPVVEPKATTPDDVRVSSAEESTYIPDLSEESRRPNTSKSINRQHVSAHVRKDPHCVKFGSSQTT